MVGAVSVVLALNVGSSSLKFALFSDAAGPDLTELARGEAEDIGGASSRIWLRMNGAVHEDKGAVANQEDAITAAFAILQTHALPAPTVVGHRLVHGGPKHSQPTRIDAAILAALREAIPFAPLHLPAELRAIEVVAARFPSLVQVACFDTAFHAELPAVAQRLPLPAALFEQGIRRYGFHGLSYEYVTTTLGGAAMGRAVIAHLGSGASLAAVHHDRSIDTTMGLTPTGGIMMGTRTGDLDPGVMIYLLNAGYDSARLEQLVDHQSGVLGVSGMTSDMKTLLASRDERAVLAVEMFAYQIRKSIGAFAAALGGLDTMVFTGGIGEHAPVVRERCCVGLSHLGVTLDAVRNASSAQVISAEGSACAVRVVATNEELMIARHSAFIARR